mgnify:CR=1 FL=1
MYAIEAEDPRQDDVRALVSELNDVLLGLTPAEYCYHLSVEEMVGPETTVFVARDGGTAVGCGALYRHPGRCGEVKRMYTRPEFAGRGIGGGILSRIIETARAEGISELVLETGDRHPAAWRVYERAGFTRCGPVLDYADTGFSIFYRLPLEEVSLQQQ